VARLQLSRERWLQMFTAGGHMARKNKKGGSSGSNQTGKSKAKGK